MIHVGYGIEFGIPLLVAEGLAQSAVHQSAGFFQTIISENKSPSMTALDIILATREDHRFDNMIKWDSGLKDLKATIDSVPNLLQEYLEKWTVSETLDGLRTRAKELQVLATKLYAGPQRPEKAFFFDFYLMHSLTSSLFLTSYIELLDVHYGAKLLRDKFTQDLIYYIARNRPLLNFEQFKSWPTISWSEIFSKAIAHSDDHIAKVIRALKHASTSDKTIPAEIYQAIATIGVDNAKWCTESGIGFDEQWKDIPDRKKF